MNTESDNNAEIEAKKKAEAKATLIVRVIFTGVVVALIAVLAAIAIYGEKLDGGAPPPDAAENH